MPIKNKIPLDNINNIYTRRWKGENTTSAVGDVTKSGIAVAPCEVFTHVRVVHQNTFDSGTAIEVAGVLLAVTATGTTDTEKVVPSVGNILTSGGSVGYQTGWVPVTYNNGDTTTPTLNPRSYHGTNPSNDVGFTFSDWMTLHSIVPTDRSGNPYIMWRTYYTTASHTVLNHGQGAKVTDNTNETYIQSFNASGDNVTDPSTMTSGTASNTSSIHALEFISNKRVVKVLCGGDSITQGQSGSTGTFDNFYGYAEYSQERFNALDFPVNMLNAGIAAGSPDISEPFMLRAIAAHKPAIVLYCPTSPGIYTASTLEIHFRRAMSVAKAALENGALPVFTWLAPNNGPTYAQDLYRIELRRRLIQSGIDLLDMTQDIQRPTEPVSFISGTTDDGTHPNAAGYQLMAPYCVNYIQKLLQENNLLTR